jgi:predicted CxxxxCH...CXXCH cytochrome family protein
VLLNCTSCHNVPPNGAAPAGDVRPNREGAHAEHNALPKVTGVCATCHSGAGTDTINHFDSTEPATVVFLPAYNAESGAAVFSGTGRTCSNVSCHGGQVTPVWLSGNLDVNTQCTSCHQAGTTQFNSYFSGDHNLHLNNGFADCLDCHNTTTLATAHFTNLDTPAMEGPAGATIGGAGTLINAGNYIDSTNSCTPVCHGNETW